MICTCCTSFAQKNRINIFRSAFEKTPVKEEKRKIALHICEQYYSLWADSLFRYVHAGLQLSAPGSIEYVRLQNYYSIALYKAGKINEALATGDSLIQYILPGKIAGEVRMDILSAHCGGLIRNGQHKEAIQEAFNMLEYAERVKDIIGMVKGYTLTGWAHMDLEQYRAAIRWLN